MLPIFISTVHFGDLRTPLQDFETNCRPRRLALSSASSTTRFNRRRTSWCLRGISTIRRTAACARWSHFRRQMERLAERDISVYIVHGNHDPLNGWGSEFQLPPNVTTFTGKPNTEPVIRRGKEIARVTGISYARERVTENLAAAMKPDSDSPYSVGLLHANVAGQTGHADYAPVTLDELTASGFDYWALGHVHTRSVLAADPATVVYPGNPQGRNPREPGPRGCLQVDVDRNGDAQPQFCRDQSRPLDSSRDSDSDAHANGRSRGRAPRTGARCRRVIRRADGRALHVARETVRCTRIFSATAWPRSFPSSCVPCCRSSPFALRRARMLDFASLARTETLVADFLKTCGPRARRSGDCERSSPTVWSRSSAGGKWFIPTTSSSANGWSEPRRSVSIS